MLDIFYLVGKGYLSIWASAYIIEQGYFNNIDISGTIEASLSATMQTSSKQNTVSQATSLLTAITRSLSQYPP